ncbi:hypothetical protein PGT21_029936 [Puccinia graminis f. sp. tritici]|uniref:Uncharacterized protein n=1 Tax=Puccinia graminis f. sp. tritici TaxID=56615 RepID=A0A5B0MGP1_PUCGR|nr:hypothetical protein PGT21_029936 [Puccinia graminis f. sp. tritici]
MILLLIETVSLLPDRIDGIPCTISNIQDIVSDENRVGAIHGTAFWWKRTVLSCKADEEAVCDPRTTSLKLCLPLYALPWKAVTEDILHPFAT